MECFGYVGREPFSGIPAKNCDGSHFFWTLVFQLVPYDNVNVEVHAVRCIMYDPVAAIGFVDHSLAGYSQGIAWVLVSRFLVRPSCSFFQSASQKKFLFPTQICRFFRTSVATHHAWGSYVSFGRLEASAPNVTYVQSVFLPQSYRTGVWYTMYNV